MPRLCLVRAAHSRHVRDGAGARQRDQQGALVGQVSAKEALDAGAKAWKEIMDKNGFFSDQRAVQVCGLGRRRLGRQGQEAAVLMAETGALADAPECGIRPPGMVAPDRSGGAAAPPCAGRCPICWWRRRSSICSMITLYPGALRHLAELLLVRFNSWTFAGVDNYQKLLGDREFWAALGNTVIIGAIALPLETVIAHGAGLLAYRDACIRGWRIVFLMPMLFMPSAVAFIWKLAFNDGRVDQRPPDAARAHREATSTGSASVWLARTTLIVADVWQWTPFLFIIFVAALQGQDQEIEEAARLDGASWGSIFWNISLPMMRPVIAVAVILRGIDITTMFTNVYIMTQGTPGGATETMSYFIYRRASAPSTSAMPRRPRW